MGSKHYVFGIDQGTTGTHVLIIDDELKIRGKAYRELRQFFPRSGWVEHDLEEIWRSVTYCVDRALRSAQVAGKEIAAIGITNQRETTALWHRESGKPINRAIVWQDRRTAEQCAVLKERGEEARVRARTGLVLDPYFSGTKISWLLEHVPGARAQAERGEL